MVCISTKISFTLLRTLQIYTPKNKKNKFLLCKYKKNQILKQYLILIFLNIVIKKQSCTRKCSFTFALEYL